MPENRHSPHHDVHTGRRRNGTMRVVLTASLALNMFLLGWLAASGDGGEVGWGNDLASQESTQVDIIERVLIDRLTANLSPEGVQVFMDVYTKHMQSLGAMKGDLSAFQAELKSSIRGEHVTTEELKAIFEPLPLAVMKRVSIMTDIMAEAIPRLSHEDRLKLPPFGEGSK